MQQGPHLISERSLPFRAILADLGSSREPGLMVPQGRCVGGEAGGRGVRFTPVLAHGLAGQSREQGTRNLPLLPAHDWGGLTASPPSPRQGLPEQSRCLIPGQCKLTAAAKASVKLGLDRKSSHVSEGTDARRLSREPGDTSTPGTKTTRLHKDRDAAECRNRASAMFWRLCRDV